MAAFVQSSDTRGVGCFNAARPRCEPRVWSDGRRLVVCRRPELTRRDVGDLGLGWAGGPEFRTGSGPQPFGPCVACLLRLFGGLLVAGASGSHHLGVLLDEGDAELRGVGVGVVAGH